jgi:polygalacturonase
LGISFLAAQSIQDEVNTHLKNLPFASFSIKVPTFPDRVFNIKDAGAVGDGVVKNTEAINSTIKKCSEAGGGTVLVPAGLWLTAAITMQSNVNLHLEAGAIIVFSSDINDYPLIGDDFSRIQSLINGTGLKNVAITGKGIFNGNGDAWRPIKKEKLNEKQWKALIKTGEVSADGKMWYPRKGTIAAIELKQNTPGSELKTREANEKVRLTMRPYLLNVEKVDGMLVEGITLQNSPHITNMLRSIDGLVMKDVKVLNNWWSQNADGLDISACRNVLLYDCIVNTGDDGICMKSSGNPEKGKFRLENIVIKDCQVFHGHGGFVIGSNTDGGMNNIYVSNCVFSWTETGLRFKSDVGRGGRVQNVFIENIYMKDIEKEAIIFDLAYQDKGAITSADFKESQAKVPDINGISIKNVYSEGSKVAISIGGTEMLNAKNLLFQNMIIQANEGVKANFSENVTMDNVQIISKIKPAYRLSKVNGFTFRNIRNIPADNYIKVLGETTKNISIENSDIKIEQIELLDNLPASTVKFK